jgi:hypothetical protein
MMAHKHKVIQHRFPVSRFRKEKKNGRNQPESVATFNQNQWPVSTGIDGHFGPEYAFGFYRTVSQK